MLSKLRKRLKNIIRKAKTETISAFAMDEGLQPDHSVHNHTDRAADHDRYREGRGTNVYLPLHPANSQPPNHTQETHSGSNSEAELGSESRQGSHGKHDTENPREANFKQKKDTDCAWQPSESLVSSLKQIDENAPIKSSAKELDDRTKDGAVNVDQEQWDAADRIVDVIYEADCSVRLHNAIISRADELQLDTVQGYMKSPEYARLQFIKLPNLGRKSFDELDQIIRRFASNHPERFDTAERDFEHAASSSSLSRSWEKCDAAESLTSELYGKAVRRAEVFFCGLKYPDELFEWSPPQRLANHLQAEREEHSTNFSDFLKTYYQTTSRLLSQKNFGRKSLRELDRIVSQLIEYRLESCGAKKEIGPILRKLMLGSNLPQHNLRQIIELENRPPAINETSHQREYLRWLTENLSILDIIFEIISELETRPRDILLRRYGIGQERMETLEELATDYNVTRERIRQIQQKAKEKIRKKKRRLGFIVDALAREGTLEKLFKERKIIPKERLGEASEALKAEERLGIDLAYGNIGSFLDAESCLSKAGWIREQDSELVSNELESFSESPYHRIVGAIRNQHLPIRLSRIVSAMPDYPVSVIKEKIVTKLDASFDGDIVRRPSRLPSPVGYILVLREAGRAMHLDEIRARMHEVFGKHENVGQISSRLSQMQEVLIVGRGTYNLYENLRLTIGDLTEIRDRACSRLEVVGGFVSTKVLFSALFQGDTERFGNTFGPYMLLGILQDDERFETKPGLMIGLTGEESLFRGLREDALEILSEANRSMTVKEISHELQGRRNVDFVSISTQLESSSKAVSLGKRRFDLTSRVIGNDERQTELILASAITLLDGGKTAFALAEILNSVWGNIDKIPLLSFLRGQRYFKINRNILTVVELPKAVSNYVNSRNQVPRQETTGLFDLQTVREALESRGVSDLTHLDYSFHENGEVDNTKKILGKILADFGID